MVLSYNIKKNEKSFFYLLSILDKVFKKHDIEYWLECGSLIGAIREGTYLKWDDDMDISIHARDMARVRKLKKEFSMYDVLLTGIVKFGINHKKAHMCIFPQHTVEKKGRSYLVQYHYKLYQHAQRKLSPKLNCMLLKSKLFIYMCTKVKVMQTIRSPLDNLGNYAYISFCDTICPIPQYPDEYLTYMFGDWRTPHKFHGEIGNMYNIKIYK